MLMIVTYRDLRDDLEVSLRSLAHFIGVSDVKLGVQCALKYTEGHFHRHKAINGMDRFGGIAINQTKVTQGKMKVKSWIKDCLAKKHCFVSGCGFKNL